MITVKLSYPANWHWPAERQTPGRAAVWGNCRFLINQPVKECDYWVVFGHLDEPEATRCPPNNTLLITGEPPSIRSYSKKFAGQFAAAISCHPDLPCAEVLLGQQALPWHLGRKQGPVGDVVWDKDYDELKATGEPEKTKLLSVISSDKDFTPGHCRRSEFVAKLKEHFGDRLDVFGRGVREIEDKWDALAPYKYHFALENSSYPHYWTEKLSDTFLAYSFPIYGGCPNVQDYFPEGSLLAIDMDRPESAMGAIEKALQQNLWECSREARAEARNLVLDKYNLFALVAGFVEERVKKSDASRVRVRLRPDVSVYHRFLRFLMRVKSRLLADY